MFRENEHVKEYADVNNQKYTTGEDSPEVSPSISDSAGTGLDLDFHHSEDEEELSEEDLQRLQEMDEQFSADESAEGEEEQLTRELQKLEGKAEARKEKAMKEQRLRELKKQVRMAKLRNKTAPVSDKLSRLEGLLGGFTEGNGDKVVSFKRESQGFSLGRNKFDLSFGRNQEIEKRPPGVSPSVKAGHKEDLFGKRESMIRLGFGSHESMLSWDAKKGSGISFDAKPGSGFSLFGENKKSKKKSKKNENKMGLGSVLGGK